MPCAVFVRAKINNDERWHDLRISARVPVTALFGGDVSVPHDNTATGPKLSAFNTQRVIVENVSPAIEGSPYAV